MKIRATYMIMLVLAIGLLAYSAPVMAGHGTNPNQPNDGHWDNWTVNDTDNVGLKGYLFIPSFLRLRCDEDAIHGPPAGFTKADQVFARGLTGLATNPGNFNDGGGCTQHAWASLSAWTSGGFFDPRGGTGFIPPSGDHHRSGARTLLQVPFSGGSWLTGFAPALGAFPFYNLVGVPGAGEAPEGILRYCQAGIAPFNVIPPQVFSTDFNGDGSTGTSSGNNEACEDWAALGAAAIMVFVDHHGEPLTPGRFPRYIPHQRQGWPNTVVTKYTASSQNEGHGISQLFHTSMSFIDGSKDTAPVIWYSMSSQNSGEGCAGGWCAWSYNPVTHTLCKTENASPGETNPGALDGTCSGVGATLVTQAIVVDSLGAISMGGAILSTHTLNKFEKSPAVIYQKLGQFVEMDTDAARPNATFDPASLATFTHNEGPGDLEQSGQAVWYEFWGLSGPNFQAEESQDPYTWALCGTRGAAFGEKPCATEDGGIDSPLTMSGNNAVWAVVKPLGDSLGGLDPIQRYGSVGGNGVGDLRPTTGETCTGLLANRDPSFCGKLNVMVACTPGGAALPQDPNTALDETAIVTSDCASFPGADGAYGTADDGTIYYSEATENGLRAFTRENRATAFSFINGIGINHPELCANSVGGNDCADSPSTGTRQVMFQNIQDLGATLSCFNCSALGQHTVPTHGFDRYNFKWTPLPGVHIPEDHPNSNGNIPEAGGEPSNGF
jgi:hypothetical protein